MKYLIELNFVVGDQLTLYVAPVSEHSLGFGVQGEEGLYHFGERSLAILKLIDDAGC